VGDPQPKHEYYAEGRGLGTLDRHPGVWIVATIDKGATEEYLAWLRERMIPIHTEVHVVRGFVEYFLCALIFDDDTALEWRMCWS
jgi:hypothetical protein